MDGGSNFETEGRDTSLCSRTRRKHESAGLELLTEGGYASLIPSTNIRAQYPLWVFIMGGGGG